MSAGYEKKFKYHVNISFKWFDFWIGVFVNANAWSIYICLLPMLPIKIWRTEHLVCPNCDHLMRAEAYLDAGGWLLDWHCSNCEYYTEGEYEWPFGDEGKSAAELEELGFKII